MADLSHRVALVTGGGRGIGRAIALHLAARGAKVVVMGQKERQLGETVGEIAHAGGAARHAVGDVRRPEDLAAAVAGAIEVFGALDVAVANAGTSSNDALGDGADALARSEDVIRTNLLGTLYTFDAAARAMREGGRLIAISSVLAKFGVARRTAYCASKAGVHGLVRAAALELAPRRITCNAICPGWADTEMAEESLANLARERGVSLEEAKRGALAEVPIGRFVQPEEVAALVAYLSSDAAGAITGQAISICGGVTSFGS